MPFLICRDRQRGIDKRNHRLGKFWGTTIADPLSISSVHHETGSLEGRHMAGHPGLAGTEFAHQFANTVLAAIPEHPKGFEPDWLCESGKNND